ncbi:arginine--tRNA ligase [Patescibacteria group bacterium]|nr:arginine--tRNA ligase [Patescibacteria group bacterium]
MNEQNAWLTWSTELAEKVGDILGTKVEANDLVPPQDANWGDLSYPCFRAAKSLGKNPAELAQMVAHGLQGKLDWVAEVVAMGPYVNIRLQVAGAVERVIQDVEAQGADYGMLPMSATGPVVFEYANPNTHKEIHIGHLRLFILGAAIIRVMKAAGRPVIPVSYINDVGSNVAKCLWQLVRAHEGSVMQLSEQAAKELLERIPAERHTGKYLGQLYTESTLAAEEPGSKEEISYVLAQLEAHTPAWEILWRETHGWCVQELKQIFQEVGVDVEKQYFESDYLDESSRLVDELLAKGIAKESQGAIIVDMEEQKLGVLLLRKSDGNLLYAAKDLPLADQKMQDYPQASALQVMTDVRQVPYIKQLAEVMKRRGITLPFLSMGYELVRLPEGAMSSRKGNIVTYQALRDAVLEYALQGVTERHPEWSKEKVEDTARQLAFAGIIFSMLRQDNDKIVTFEMKEALSFDGATGPYCQYAVIRLSSILRKAANKGLKPSKDVPNAYAHASEKALALSLAAFPHVVALAGRDQRPSVIAHWCVEAAQNVNAFYRDVPVMDATPDEAASRLRLAQAAKQVLTLGLGLLGIAVPEEM